MEDVKRVASVPLAVAREGAQQGSNPVTRLLLIMGAILLMILPFVTTFNEFLTRIVETLGLDAILTDWVVPIEARMTAALLGLIGISAQVSQTTVYLDKGGFYLPVYINWNCVGWQSFILFLITLATGIQGPYTRASKLESIALGFLGTYLLNLFRLASVAVVAYHFGQLPALIYHDYGGTIFTLAWLFGYWYFVHGWVLEPLETLPEGGIEERYLKELYHGESKPEEKRPPRRWLGWLKR